MASSLNVSANDIEQALFTSYGERQISNIYTTVDEYKVIMQLKPEFQKNADALSMLYIRSDASGQLIRLDALGRIRPTTGPMTVNHNRPAPVRDLQLQRARRHVHGRDHRGHGQARPREAPAQVSTMFEGTAGAFAESMNSLYFLLGIAIVAIYILLGCLYESFIHPLTILSGLPSAAFGGLVTLLLFGYDLDLYGMVGIIMLIGIVKKNSIMVVDFALAAEKTGLSPEEAAFQARPSASARSS